MTIDEARQVLGVDSDAAPGEIRAAYRQRAATAHPDTGGGREDWDQLTQAYAMLAAELPPELDIEAEQSGERRWRDLPRWLRMLAATAAGAVVLGAAGVYLFWSEGAQAVPWQPKAALLAYPVGWWLWWLLGEFRRPNLTHLRWFIVPIPTDRAGQERLAEAMREHPRRRRGKSSRRSGNL